MPTKMQKGMRLNDGHVTYLGLLAKKDGARKGYLSKRSSDNTKWHTKWFALLQNMLFYFETDSSSRPSGLYLLEGCVCDRAPSPKPSLSAKDSLEKQVGATGARGRRLPPHRPLSEGDDAPGPPLRPRGVPAPVAAPFPRGGAERTCPAPRTCPTRDRGGGEAGRAGGGGDAARVRGAGPPAALPAHPGAAGESVVGVSGSARRPPPHRG